MERLPSIVVGVDGSPHGLRALRFALAEAQLRGCSLKAVSVWHIPPAAYDGGWAPPPVEYEAMEEGTKKVLATSLTEVDAVGSGIAVTSLVREGQPAEVLVEEAKDADLLVVGSRGLGGFRGLLLGSVGQQVAHHAPCPVVIVPAAD
jgi:nucleotide-binding universal stress UspA family protein